MEISAPPHVFRDFLLLLSVYCHSTGSFLSGDQRRRKYGYLCHFRAGKVVFPLAITEKNENERNVKRFSRTCKRAHMEAPPPGSAVLVLGEAEMRQVEAGSSQLAQLRQPSVFGSTCASLV